MKSASKAFVVLVAIIGLFVLVMNPALFQNFNASDIRNKISSNIPSNIPNDWWSQIPTIPNPFAQGNNHLPFQSVIPQQGQAPSSPPSLYVADVNVRVKGEYLQDTAQSSATIKNPKIESQIVTFRDTKVGDIILTQMPPQPTRSQKDQVIVYLVIFNNFEGKQYYSEPVMTRPMNGNIIDVTFRLVMVAGANYQIYAYSSTGFNGLKNDIPIIKSLSL